MKLTNQILEQALQEAIKKIKPVRQSILIMYCNINTINGLEWSSCLFTRQFLDSILEIYTGSLITDTDKPFHNRTLITNHYEY